MNTIVVKAYKLSSFCIIICLIAFTNINCKSDKKEKSNFEYEKKIEEKPNYIEVITRSMEFQTVDTLLSGWNKFVYKNLSNETHFFLMDKLPSDSINADDITKGLLPPFDDAMRFITEGNNDSVMAAFGRIPAWFYDVKRYGGSGLISPKGTAISTINLEPGKYMMECYIKMPNGQWHTSHGMWKFLTVKSDSTSTKLPTNYHNINISSKKGIEFEDQPKKGKNIFKAHFIDQMPYEHFSGHDVNLVKYKNGASIDSLIHWMNWMNVDGMRTPSPSGFTFLGGMNNCEAGGSGYFEVDLKSGNYILISETPKAKEKGLFKTFTVN